MRVIIAGSRTVTDLKLVSRAIAKSGFLTKIQEVVSGGAKGVDELGETWAWNNQIDCMVFYANWNDISGKHEPVVVKENKFGKKYNAIAGHNRNERMAEYADALIAVWDGKSKGTLDMIHRAKAHGLKIYVYRTDK